MTARDSKQLIFKEPIYKLVINKKKHSGINLQKIHNKKDKLEKIANIPLTIENGYFEVSNKSIGTMLFAHSVDVVALSRDHYNI